MNRIILDMGYNFKGSINCALTMQENDDGGVDLITSYGERICSVHDGHELWRILSSLDNDELA